jgi:hypothetical protein
MRGLYLGLDNTQPNIARVVCVTTVPGWSWLPSVHAWARSSNLQAFQSYWSGAVGLRPDGLATTSLRHDPFGVMAWLEGRYELPFTRYDKYDLYHGLDEAGDPDLPPCYHRAYSLALQVAFASEAPAVAIELNDSLHRMQERMLELRRVLDRLVHAIPF